MYDKRFIDRYLFQIRGFLHPVDGMVLSCLSQAQAHEGLSGSISEIGVFFGRSFALLCRSLQTPHERAVAIDLFDIGLMKGERLDQLSYFRKAVAEAGVSLDSVEIFKGDSRGFTAANVEERVGKIRFFSIDGGHDVEHVINDCAIADSCLQEHGIVAFDDFFNVEFPGVSEAVIAMLKAGKYDLTPFCITRNKLYVCRTKYHDFYRNIILNFRFWAGVERKEVVFLERGVIWCHQSLLRRAFYQKAAEIGWAGVVPSGKSPFRA